ncbi:MAG: GPR endopeptidase [Clostridia bacterium]|nr:GPR endopeptidase [Clostridia bacterium]
MQFSSRVSELYTEFALPADKACETEYTIGGWKIKQADHHTGQYHTLYAGDILTLSAETRASLIRAAAHILSGYLEGASCILVCGLGNGNLTADRLGVSTCRHLTIPGSLPGGRSLYTFCPGVSAATGLPTDTLVAMTAECIRADRILAVDALCARGAASLSAVLQYTDTGLTPGSGSIGTSHADPDIPPEISTRTMPCPVVTAGVPTVIRTTLPEGGDRRYLVTTGQIDRAVDCWSSVLASAILRTILSPGK